jgi:hypothetical protein
MFYPDLQILPDFFIQVSKSITWELCNGTSNSDFIHLIANLLWMSLSENLQTERILVLGGRGGGESLLFILNQICKILIHSHLLGLWLKIALV